MNTIGPLLYKISCKKPSLLTEEGLKHIHHRFVNDPVRLGYIKAKQDILTSSIPVIIVDTANNTIETKYDDETTAALDKIDRELCEYINREYGEYLSFTIKEER